MLNQISITGYCWDASILRAKLLEKKGKQSKEQNAGIIDANLSKICSVVTTAMLKMKYSDVKR